MRGYCDLHCHFIPGIDDGAPTLAEAERLLRGLFSLGFDTVIATPHMRPGMFDNQRGGLIAAYERARAGLRDGADLPALALSSEHYFDSVVFARLLAGEGLPYPGEKAVLLEFYEQNFPVAIDRQLGELRRRGLLPVIAHPERYRCLWRSPETLERLVDAGAAALLDTAALVGKYGRAPEDCAEELLERGLYHAACSDAHRASDVELVAAGMRRIEELYGAEEVDYLFRVGPQALL
ncbi:MAG TPA: CpsB/CapC family capsule biosynthesis tyrosine phosphatase, partial [Polyangiaceae bacterium]|nr:CpsB/CapC family capsule biosynthesis tyrosine phosphatase [Polyangiaceae bacterium]